MSHKQSGHKSWQIQTYFDWLIYFLEQLSGLQVPLISILYCTHTHTHTTRGLPSVSSTQFPSQGLGRPTLTVTELRRPVPEVGWNPGPW